MTPVGKPYITYRGRKYKGQERRLELTFGKGDNVPVVDAEEEEQMAEERDVGKEFRELLLRSMLDLSRRIEEMGQRFMVESRQCETPRGFHIVKGSGTSPHLQEHITA